VIEASKKVAEAKPPSSGNDGQDERFPTCLATSSF
jgi:hypothetical protein